MVFSILSQKTKVPLDELALELGWKVSTTASQLMQMEMKGLIRALPGKQFEWI
jgi:predicted Rossmann fold nucleotide-binding protein DprA/Smf involved in DNA uptake